MRDKRKTEEGKEGDTEKRVKERDRYEGKRERQKREKVVRKRVPSSSRQERAGGSDPGELILSASSECWGNGICHPQISLDRSAHPTGRPPRGSICGNHGDTLEAPEMKT